MGLPKHQTGYRGAHFVPSMEEAVHIFKRLEGHDEPMDKHIKERIQRMLDNEDMQLMRRPMA
jgi:hypothetical protein